MANTPLTTPETDLLKRYRNGLCTPEEARQVDNWFDAQEIENVPPLLKRRSVGEINRAVMRAVSTGQQRSNYFFLKIAAMLLLAVMAGALGYRQLHKVQVLPGYTTVSTKAGERKTVILPDSTRIWLNNVSSVKFASDFSGKTRDVLLTGEAFFEVKHDGVRPFIVSTGKLKIQVLGTSFNVKAFPGDAYSNITVASGKVGVYATQQQTAAHILLPGQQLTYQPASGQFEQRNVNAGDQYAWQRGVLIFKGENLTEIAHQLERAYGVSITITGAKLAKEKFNIKQNNESLAHVLQSLSLSGEGFNYRIKGRQVLIWQ